MIELLIATTGQSVETVSACLIGITVILCPFFVIR